MVDEPAPRVSIGLPVYNAGAFLEPALLSVMDQTYEDFEFIISDNASTDGTSQLCRDLAAADPRVRYYRNPTNRGAAFNHNRLVSLARGRYFKWCGHDDLIEPTFVERCVGVLDADVEQRYVLCFTQLDAIDERGRPVDGSIQSPVFDDESPHRRLRSFWDAPRMHQTIYALIRRDALAATGLIADYYGSDRQTLIELALLGGFARVDEVLFHHREHAGRSQYSRDKRAWMTAAMQTGTPDLGYWRRLGFIAEILGREYLAPGDRLKVAAEYARYGVRRGAHWLPQLGREVGGSAAAAVGRMTNRRADAA